MVNDEDLPQWRKDLNREVNRLLELSDPICTDPKCQHAKSEHYNVGTSAGCLHTDENGNECECLGFDWGNPSD